MVQFEVVILHEKGITKMNKIMPMAPDDVYDVYYGGKDFREIARKGQLTLSPSSKYVIYDNFNKRIAYIPTTKDYVLLGDECRKMNDQRLYDRAVNEYLNLN